MAAPDRPSVGLMVHYVSHGTPPRPDGSQAYISECRAAIITAVAEVPIYGIPGGPVPPVLIIGLAVLNPTGMHFNRGVEQDEGRSPGTWHWLETCPGSACCGS